MTVALSVFSDGAALFDALVAQALVAESDAQLARAMHAGGKLGPMVALVRTGSMHESRLVQVAAQVLGCKVASGAALASMSGELQTGLKALGLGLGWCRTQRLGLCLRGQTLVLVCTDLLNTAQAEVVRQIMQRLQTDALDVSLCLPAHLEGALQSLDSAALRVGPAASLSQLKVLAEEGPVIELVNQILSQGAFKRASDIHVEAKEAVFSVRYRVDGAMSAPTDYPRAQFDAVVVRIKILAELDISERRLPQDGRIQVRLNADEFDIRVSVLPATFGESIVMRLLRSKREMFSLGDLGMHASDEAFFAGEMQRPNGIILVTGPTGSGKSTTLYTGLSLLNDGERKIITVEDPVEYRIEGITQVQANAAVGLDFARSLRSILRHDPDVIFVGEIRDKETAEIAVQAALTGHLVLSTLHTNSAVGSITRLIDMGIEPYLVTATVRSLVAQRLVRRLCVSCKVPVQDVSALEAAAEQLNAPHKTWNWQLACQRHDAGCEACGHTGYHGRLAVYEFASMTEGVRDLVRHGQLAELPLAAAARSLGSGTQALSSLLEDGLRKVAAGVTSLDEVLSVVSVAE